MVCRKKGQQQTKEKKNGMEEEYKNVLGQNIEHDIQKIQHELQVLVRLYAALSRIGANYTTDVWLAKRVLLYMDLLWNENELFASESRLYTPNGKCCTSNNNNSGRVTNQIIDELIYKLFILPDSTESTIYKINHDIK